MKRWHRILLGIVLLSGGSQLFKNSHTNSELGAALVLFISFCIIICSFWLFFGKIKKTATLNAASSSSVRYKCVDCNKIVQESDLINDALLCPSCHGRIEQV